MYRKNTFNNIRFYADTVTHIINDISNNLNFQINNKVKGVVSFNIALDLSTDVSDTSKLLIFIRGVNKDLEV